MCTGICILSGFYHYRIRSSASRSSVTVPVTADGELAQLAERVLSMHEVAGSIPAFSILFCVGVV